MKCPHCGQIVLDGHRMASGARFRAAIDSRLQEYGVKESNSPEKHQAALAVRKVIALRFGIKARSGGSMTTEDADRGIKALDKVMPPPDSRCCLYCTETQSGETAPTRCTYDKMNVPCPGAENCQLYRGERQ